MTTTGPNVLASLNNQSTIQGYRPRLIEFYGLREAADLANIDNEAVIESRFRAGLLKEIKLFCIQSSSRTFQDWINHSEGWWNAHRPRKIAMVDNPFIPRNVNNALIYHDDNTQYYRHSANNHNIELIDTEERPIHYVPVTDMRTNVNYEHLNNAPNVVTGSHQLTTMDIVGQMKVRLCIKIQLKTLLTLYNKLFEMN
ncbi:hypothetical protein G6F20_013217 [Rhizopus arrhizus]|nr:hypothetical protein G6F20_013217 [Rhizopus arrhizus]